MFSKVLKRLSGDKSSKRSNAQEPSVDISRVLPGYKPLPTYTEAQKAASQPGSAEEEQPDLTQNEADIDAETSRQDKYALILSHDLPDMEDRAEAAVAALAQKYDTWAQNDLDALRKAWDEARNHADLSDHLNEVLRTAHNLTGMAKTYGHPAMARITASLCTLLKSGQVSHQHALINLHVEACRAAYFEGVKTEGSDTVAQSVCVALETQVKRTLEA